MVRKKIIVPALMAVTVVLGMIAGAGVYYLQRPVPATGAIHEVFVSPGMTVAQVADTLYKEGLIRNAYWFKLLARYRGVDKRLHVGRYRLETGVPIADILTSLATGAGGTLQVTIPEGLTLSEAAGIFHARADIDSVAFMALARDPAFTARMGIDAPTLEGYLFPETYDVYRQMAPASVLKEMTSMFHRVFTVESRAQAEKLGYSAHEIITLASIIEKEARLAEERPVISGVFHNRLRIGIPLQADPTVKYALGKPKGRLWKKNLDHPSPYNTYLHAGLPPGPICSPGAAAIRAALYPKEVPYLYFVARGDGSHIFSKSNREHNNARLRVKRNKT